MKSAIHTQRTVSATEARAHFGRVIQRACEDDEHVIVKRDGIPVIAILSISEYHRLIKIGHFDPANGYGMGKRGYGARTPTDLA